MIYSEIVVKYIIEKLISYTLTESNRLQHAKELPSFCNEYVRNLLTETLNLELLTYDQDLTEKNQESGGTSSLTVPPLKTIFLENRISGVNDYSYMEVPVI